MTKEDADTWLNDNPRCKELIDKLEASGVLKKMNFIQGPDGINLVIVARAAGYKLTSESAATNHRP